MQDLSLAQFLTKFPCNSAQYLKHTSKLSDHEHKDPASRGSLDIEFSDIVPMHLYQLEVLGLEMLRFRRAPLTL